MESIEMGIFKESNVDTTYIQITIYWGLKYKNFFYGMVGPIGEKNGFPNYKRSAS